MKYIPNDEDKNFILENYMKMTSSQIANILGCSASYVKKIGRQVSKGNKKRNSYFCNENYFENIETYEQSYWLGFIMADGCIHQRRSNCNAQKMIVINLQYKDIEHLNKFKQAIESNHPITKISHNNKEYCRICIVSDKMANDLSVYGCVERKTGSIKMPNFNTDELKFGFIHGYIDGDGSITITKDKNVYRYRLSIVGNQEIIKDIDNFLFTKFGFHGIIREDKRNYSFPFYSISWERMEQLNLIFLHTYLKEIIYLDRKYERVIKYYSEKYDKNKEYYNLCRS